MTREEAVKYIKSRCIGSANERDGTKWSDAMWTAIEALSNADQRTKHIESVDLINRQDAIDALMNDSDWADAIPTIKSLPSADRPTEWIPVSERLPKVDEEVLVTMEWGDVLIAWYDKFGKWETDEWYDLDNILAWMPLPEPYREDGEKQCV